MIFAFTFFSAPRRSGKWTTTLLTLKREWLLGHETRIISPYCSYFIKKGDNQ